MAKHALQMLKKHKKSILNHEFSEFYKEIILKPPVLKDPVEIRDLVNYFSGLEREDYEKARKKRNYPCISQEEMPVTKAFELIVREHLIGNIDIKAAEGIRNFIIDVEKDVTHQVANKGMALHEDPSGFCDAELLLLKYLTHDKKKFEKVHENVKKGNIRRFHNLVSSIGPEALRRAMSQVVENIDEQKSIVQFLAFHQEFDSEHQISNGMMQFYEKGYKHIDVLMRNMNEVKIEEL